MVPTLGLLVQCLRIRVDLTLTILASKFARVANKQILLTLWLVTQVAKSTQRSLLILLEVESGT